MKKDPYKHEQRYFEWKEDVKEGIQNVSGANSEIIISYVTDMEKGINVSALSVKGSRSYARLNTLRGRLMYFVRKFKELFDLDSIRIPYRSKFGKNPKGKNPGDCLIFPLEPRKEHHSAMFPSSMPEFCIKAGCPKEGIVLDPFMGSGTTALVCKRLERNFIGFEINKNYIDIAEGRLRKSGNF